MAGELAEVTVSLSIVLDQGGSPEMLSQVRKGEPRANYLARPSDCTSVRMLGDNCTF